MSATIRSRSAILASTNDFMWPMSDASSASCAVSTRPTLEGGATISGQELAHVLIGLSFPKGAAQLGL